MESSESRPDERPHRSRPATATAAGLIGLLYGAFICGGCVWITLHTVWWIFGAEPGQNRWLGGWLGVVFSSLGAWFGLAMLRNGRGLLQGRPGPAETLQAQFLPPFGLFGLALIRGLFSEPPDVGWWTGPPAMLAFCGFSVAGMVLCGLRATKRYVGARPTNG
ncbi:hypothetical protein [Streptomyces hesseae]|uniref:Integral membrane protein n=1 Tax=Streptomyces hesseae TaxID=3075519 RepID=A0ABU2SS42_9ACTN|nr:hypothetical protein [Streptomyces sp. DSM 40473]MDT0450645.1 hypothetical protein [Streptomyces sp. DSM 40473]